MSQPSKNRKLSLKKHGANQTKQSEKASGNTIISMFKKQAIKQAVIENDIVKESSSEGDVVITTVIGLNTDSDQSVKKSTSNAPSVPHKHQSVQGKCKLRLSGKKVTKLKKTDSSKSDSDSDFDSKKRKTGKHKLSKSLSDKLGCDGVSKYKFRKRNTVPIVEVSDSDSVERTNEDHENVNGEELVIESPKASFKKKTKRISLSEDDENTTDKELVVESAKGSCKTKIKRKSLKLAKSVDNGTDTTTGKRYDTHNVDDKLTVESPKSAGKMKVKRLCRKDDESGKVVKDTTSDKDNDVNDDDVVIDDIIGASKSRYFSNTSKRKLSPVSKKGLSLKRRRSEIDNLGKDKSKESKEVEQKSETSNAKASDVTTEHQSMKVECNGIGDYVDNDKDKLSSSDKSTCRSEKSAAKTVNSFLMSKQSSTKISREKSEPKNNNKSSTRSNSVLSKNRAVSTEDVSHKSSKNKSSTKSDKESIERIGNVKADDDSDSEGNGNDDGNGNENDREAVEYRVPYYLENFNTIMRSVLDDEENARLFDDSDMRHIGSFNQLDESSQKLYVRLFSRKLSWLPMSKLNYPKIGDNIPDLVDTLIHAGLLQSGAGLSDLSVVLKILPAPDLKTLAKSFHINGQGMTKYKIIEALLKKGQQSSICSMFKGGHTGTMEKTILNRAKTYMGKVCRLEDQPRAVFMRILMLFSLYNTNIDEENGGGGQLFQMLMVNIGRVVYPTYKVQRSIAVFQDRAALVRFETALQLEMDIQAITERGKWSQAYEIYKHAKEAGAPVLKNKKFLKWDEKLPQFLRLYTAGSVYTRIDNQGVEILQRLKLYKEAVQLLEELLAHEVYCIHYRGHWFERLALNLEVHLKSVEKSLGVLKRGLLDPKVRTGRRLALYERARKICEAPKSKFADRISEFEHVEVLPTPEVCIEGKVISDATSMGMKYQFIMQGDSDSVTLCAVEELVLDHYKQNGFPDGLHAEGSIVSNLFVLLFWEIIFMDVDNVFLGPFQSCPLDVATRDFYLNRQQHIDERLDWLRKASVEELRGEIDRIWTEHEGKMCAGITWEKFSGPETHQNLVSCMGGCVVAGLLERYVKDPRHTRSGFPDLTLWNFDTKKFKICEVKGPNDRLSYKQILWIDYLIKLGVDAEVCYVKAVGSKKLKPIAKK